MRGTARQNSELAIKTDLCILVRCWNIESEMNRQWMVCHAFFKSDQRGVSVSLKGSISFLQAVGLNKKQMLSPDPLKLCRALKANTQLLSPRLTHHFTSQIKCLLKSGHIICDIYGRFFSCCSIMDKDNPWRQNSSPTKNQIPHLFLLSKQTKKTRICVCGEVSKCQVLVPSGTWGETDKVLQNSFWPFNPSLWFFHVCHPPTTLLCARRCQAWKSFDRFKTYSSTNCLTRAWATALTRI